MLKLMFRRDCEGRPTGDEYFGCGCETRKKRQLTFTQDESKADTEKDADRYKIKVWFPVSEFNEYEPRL